MGTALHYFTSRHHMMFSTWHICIFIIMIIYSTSLSNTQPTSSPTRAPTPYCIQLIANVTDAVGFDPNDFDGVYALNDSVITFDRPLWKNSNDKYIQYFAGSEWSIINYDVASILSHTSTTYFPPLNDLNIQWSHSSASGTFHVLIECIGSSSPTAAPSVTPSWSPTSPPTNQPTLPPSFEPTRFPSSTPTYHPTLYPSNIPTSIPTSFPTSINGISYQWMLPLVDKENAASQIQQQYDINNMEVTATLNRMNESILQIDIDHIQIFLKFYFEKKFIAWYRILSASKQPINKKCMERPIPSNISFALYNILQNLYVKSKNISSINNKTYNKDIQMIKNIHYDLTIYYNNITNISNINIIYGSLIYTLSHMPTSLFSYKYQQILSNIESLVTQEIFNVKLVVVVVMNMV
eukprot:897212_1